jgi:large subunit ribosomal protein L1
MKKSKNLQTAYDQFDRLKAYPVAEAIKLMTDTSKVKFDATAEMNFTLGIDPRHADQQIRSTVTLPHGTGQDVRVVVFCEDDQVKAAKAAGAVEAGSEELVQKVLSKGWTDFDVAVATPGIMKTLAKAARVLGPKGLMPNPKAGTVTTDIEKTVTALKAGRLEFRNDKYGLVHARFGKLSFGADKLTKNAEAMIKALQDVKPSGQKGAYIKKVTINATMGAGIKVAAEA